MRINIVCNIMERGRGWSYPRRAMELKERLKEHEIVLSKEPFANCLYGQLRSYASYSLRRGSTECFENAGFCCLSRQKII